MLLGNPIGGFDHGLLLADSPSADEMRRHASRHEISLYGLGPANRKTQVPCGPAPSIRGSSYFYSYCIHLKERACGIVEDGSRAFVDAVAPGFEEDVEGSARPSWGHGEQACHQRKAKGDSPSHSPA